MGSNPYMSAHWILWLPSGFCGHIFNMSTHKLGIWLMWWSSSTLPKVVVAMSVGLLNGINLCAWLRFFKPYPWFIMHRITDLLSTLALWSILLYVKSGLDFGMDASTSKYLQDMKACHTSYSSGLPGWFGTWPLCFLSWYLVVPLFHYASGWSYCRHLWCSSRRC